MHLQKGGILAPFIRTLLYHTWLHSLAVVRLETTRRYKSYLQSPQLKNTVHSRSTGRRIWNARCYEARGASLYLYTCRVPQHVIFVSNAIINTPTRWQHSYRVPSIITRGADKPHQNLQKTPREEKEERVLMQRPARHHSIPNPLQNHSNLSRARGFVNPSAICSAVRTYFNSTIPAS
jgi:hypothetical protein